jgi:hypothetical protein
MSIEDRVRRVLEHAVADEPPPRAAPLAAVRRRRRRRPVLAGAVAMVLVLAAVIGLAAVRGQDRVVPVAPTLTTLPTAGWPEVVDNAGNLAFRHPPGWKARRTNKAVWRLTPPGVPSRELSVLVDPTGGEWRHDGYWRVVPPEVGRLPDGRAYQLTVAGPAQGFKDAVDGGYSVDWGRTCTGTAEPGSCRPHSVQVQFRSARVEVWDQYRPQVQTVVGSLRQLRPTGPTAGDRSRPACAADQWKLVYPNATAGVPSRRRTVVPAGVGFHGGQPCHLRVQVSMAVEQGGRPLAVRSNPAPATVELDLPEDALPAGYQGLGDDRMMQLWAWDRECVPAPGTDLGVDIVFRDERGGRLLALPTLHFEQPGPGTCEAPGAASVLAAWP